MPELLIELLSEEIPARMQARAAESFKSRFLSWLQYAEIKYDFEKAEAFCTPRRITLYVPDLPISLPEKVEEKRGPKVGAPDKAIEGFLRSVGAASLEACEQREVKGTHYWFAVTRSGGGNLRDYLPVWVRETIKELPWPKSMRWGDGSFKYVRPLQRINVIFDGKPLFNADEPNQFMLEIGGVDPKTGYTRVIYFGAETEGHRFMARGPFPIHDFAQYKADLFAHKVILDPAERKAKIAADLEAAARAEGLQVRPDPGLLNEVTGLVEWPVLLVGSIDAQFMDLPPEVLTTSMREHQKYFALETADGQLAPRFAVAANRETTDGGKAVVAGNERVLRARLSDAKFFWDQDRRVKLADRVPALDNVVFHAKLGSLGERVRRMTALAGFLAKHIPGCDAETAREAAHLAKADLSSGMVGEFPELQGLMGRYYAEGEGLNPAIAHAIAEHYSPQGPSDACPTAPVSVAVALAEKIDTLVGFFAIDEKPTGSRDPFALRRAALGVIRLVLENKLRLPLYPVFLHAHEFYSGQLSGQNSADETATALLDFFADRLKVHLREQGVRHDRVAAVFGLGQQDDLVRLMAQVAALSAFLETDDGVNLLTAYRRAANIIAAEEKKDGAKQVGTPDSALFTQADETALADALTAIAGQIKQSLAAEAFDTAMGLLADLRGPTDAFFEQVTVNADDPALRVNRLKLLSVITNTMSQVADFAVIEG